MADVTGMSPEGTSTGLVESGEYHCDSSSSCSSSSSKVRLGTTLASQTTEKVTTVVVSASYNAKQGYSFTVYKAKGTERYYRVRESCHECDTRLGRRVIEHTPAPH